MAVTSSGASEPRRLAKHSILLELGRGGMADVYLAVARGPADFHKLVVLKRLRAHLASDPAFREMALGEAKIAARLNHPNVVQTYEILNEGTRPIIVMEYLEGQSLSSVLASVRDGTFTLAIRLRVLADALAGVHHAHELTDFDGRPFGLVHRDFTPQNIFLGYDGHVKILDFGIAKTHASDTDPGTFKGKVRYMAPEQIVGTSLDRRADVFSAGMVLWELATGESPWRGTAETTVIHRVTHGDLPSIGTIAPNLREDIRQICAKAIQFERDERYQTAADMEAAIEQVLSTMTARVAPRDIGRVVADHFGDVRAATKRAIEEQLAKSNSADLVVDPSLAPILQVDTYPQSESEAVTSRWSRQIKASLSITAAAGSCAALFALIGSHAHPDRSAAPAMTSPATEVTPPALAQQTAAPPAQVEIRLRAIPTSAAILFDRERLAANPAVVSRVADGAVHTVQAEARGYVPRTLQIIIDSGVDLVLTLERAPSVPNPAMQLERPHESASATMHAPPPPPDCNPPFYIDDQGIKKFKVQCI